MLTETLATARLQLRVLHPEDAPLLLAYLVKNRSHLEPWEPQREENYFTLEQCRLRLTAQWKSIELGQSVPLALFPQGRSEMIGVCNFSNIVRGAFQACHLGYAIAAHWQGHGLMAEALRSGIAHMFGQEGLHRIMANYVPENARSARLLQRLGFEREGFARSYLKINGAWRDHVLTALINPG